MNEVSYVIGIQIMNVLRWHSHVFVNDESMTKLQYLTIHILFDAFHNNDWYSNVSYCTPCEKPIINIIFSFRLCTMNVLFNFVQTFVSSHSRDLSSVPLCTLRRLCWLYVVCMRKAVNVLNS
jgi:hypothetical protein